MGFLGRVYVNHGRVMSEAVPVLDQLLEILEDRHPSRRASIAEAFSHEAVYKLNLGVRAFDVEEDYGRVMWVRIEDSMRGVKKSVFNILPRH